MAALPRVDEEPVRLARPALAPRPHRPGTFDRILVPIGADEALASRAADVAARLSSAHATVVLAFVLEVPPELPLDAFFEEEEAAARRMLRRLAATVEAYGVHVVQRLERGHSGALPVLELAGELGADMIVLAAPGRMRRSRSVFDPTVTAVLHRATCRVTLVTVPEAQVARAVGSTSR